MIRPDTSDLFRKQIAHAQARLVDGNVVDDRIRTCEVNVLENARRLAGGRRALLRIEAPLFVDEHRFARFDVAHPAEALHVERHALGGEHVFRTLRRLALAEHQRADAMRIAKADEAMADDHRNDCEAATTTAINRTEGIENIAR